MNDVIKEIEAERERQQTVEGWTLSHDDWHVEGEMATAARAMIAHATHFKRQKADNYRLAGPPSYWPWHDGWWKPKDPRRDLVRAAALIVAEIERLDRAAKETA